MTDLTKIFKALSDESRLAIYQLIRERCGSTHEASEAELNRSVSKIAEEFDLALSTVSHHLRELKNAGLIQCEKRGQRIYCSAGVEALRPVGEFLEDGGS